MKAQVLIFGAICVCRAVHGQMLEMPVPVVAGHPFSADEVTPRTLWSNLNNPVSQTYRVYRDSAGRTRIDDLTPRKPASAPLIVITDPVAGIKYVLNAETKIARRSSTRLQTPPATEDPWKVGRWGFSVPGVVETSPKIETLGVLQMSGLAAEGRRITNNIPKTEHAEAQEDVNECWYSPELQMMLLRQVHHTSMGESTTRLENIDRSEPDPLIFQVPSDYTIEDGPTKHDNRP
jgi:hypothetical protein